MKVLSNENDSLYFGMSIEDDRHLSEYIDNYLKRGYHNDFTYYYITTIYRIHRERINNQKYWYDFFDYDRYINMSFNQLLNELKKLYGKLAGYTIKTYNGENTYWGELYFCQNKNYLYCFVFSISTKEIGYESEDVELSAFYQVKNYDIIAQKYDYNAWFEFSQQTLERYQFKENEISKTITKELKELMKLIEANCGKAE